MKKAYLLKLLTLVLVFCSFTSSAYAYRLPSNAPGGCVCGILLTITYNGNGNTSGSAPASQAIVPGSPTSPSTNIILRTNTGNLAKTGFVFTGWNMNAVGTGTSYAAGEMVSLRGNATLFAEWRPIVQGAFTASVNNFFDDGYSIYYDESSSASRDNINSYMDNVSERYLDLFNLQITFPSAANITSLPDTCKQPNNNSANIDRLCTTNMNHEEICTDRLNMVNHFRQLVGGNGSCTHTKILWSGHNITSTDAAGEIEENRSCSWSSPRYLVYMARASNNIRTMASQGVLMHELNHQFGAPDHYHELSDPENLDSCVNREICSECDEPNARPSSCLMFLSRQNISSQNIICSECSDDILSHLQDNH